MINIDWYHTLNKPFLSPPDWIFAPVWTILYIMIALSLVVLIFNKVCKNKTKPIILYITQFALNLMWTPAFFYLQNAKLGFIIICLLWVVLLLTIKEFYKCSKIASFLLIPYFLWVTFALYLNVEIVRLN